VPHQYKRHVGRSGSCLHSSFAKGRESTPSSTQISAASSSRMTDRNTSSLAEKYHPWGLRIFGNLSPRMKPRYQLSPIALSQGWTSQPNHFVAMTLMKARRDNGEPEAWLQGISKTTESKKKPAVSRYRLANVLSSEQLRPAVLQ
jgi:hypothetical protein